MNKEEDMLFAQLNGRIIPACDRIFAIGNRASKKIAEEGQKNVVNATIGALLDDNGDLVVMSSVVEAISNLSPTDYAAYAPITGAPEYKKAVIKELFRKRTTNRFVEVCATPGGTGAIRNAVSNYTRHGDKVLTTDWYWAPYGTICCEIGRTLDTYEMFLEDGSYNIDGLIEHADQLVSAQGSLLIILNTPAHNPTGYSLTDEDWDKVVAGLNKLSSKRKITLLVDAAYVDFAGDEDEYRGFLDKIEGLNEGVLPLVAYSASKTFTIYGMRCGALVCLSIRKDVADEFKKINEFSSRGSWSNCTRASQMVLANITNSPKTREKVMKEREQFRNILLKRGKTFSATIEKRNVKTTPFDAGFFTCVECKSPEALSAELEKDGIFVVPLAKGIRVSIASISEEKCVKAANAIADKMETGRF